MQSDKELFAVTSLYASTTNVFMSIDRGKLQNKRALEYEPYIQNITEEDAPIPEKQSSRPRHTYQHKTRR